MQDSTQRAYKLLVLRPLSSTITTTAHRIVIPVIVRPVIIFIVRALMLKMHIFCVWALHFFTFAEDEGTQSQLPINFFEEEDKTGFMGDKLYFISRLPTHVCL